MLKKQTHSLTFCQNIMMFKFGLFYRETKGYNLTWSKNLDFFYRPISQKKQSFTALILPSNRDFQYRLILPNTKAISWTFCSEIGFSNSTYFPEKKLCRHTFRRKPKPITSYLASKSGLHNRPIFQKTKAYYPTFYSKIGIFKFDPFWRE